MATASTSRPYRAVEQGLGGPRFLGMRHRLRPVNTNCAHVQIPARLCNSPRYCRTVPNEIVLLKTAKQILGVVGSLKKSLDPNKRLADTTTETILEELARIHRLMNEHIAEIAASGCTPVEAHVIAYQAVEAMKRTAEQEKRRRLSNVVVNGFRQPKWHKATHRLMVRLTDELEEEHVLRLHQGRPHMSEQMGPNNPKEHNARVFREMKARQEENTQIETAIAPVRDAIERELIARGLIDESMQTRMGLKLTQAQLRAREEARGRVEELVPVRRVSKLGYMFLEYLRDPESEGEDESEPPDC